MQNSSIVFRTAYYVLGLLASTSRGVEILSSFGWESVCHAHNTTHRSMDERVLMFSKSENGSDLNPLSANSRQQVNLSEDLEFSGLMRRSNQRKQFPETSAVQTTDTLFKRPLSSLSDVCEVQADDSSSPDAALNRQLVPGDGNTSCSLGETLSSLTADSEWDIKQQCIDTSLESHGNGSTAGTSSFVSSAVNQKDCNSVKRHSVSNSESRLNCAARSSSTLPHTVRSESVRQTQDEQIDYFKSTQLPMSAQDLSGYIKLRDLHPPSELHLASQLPSHNHFKYSADIESYKTRSLDFRVSRLRFVCVLFLVFFYSRFELW